VVDLVFSKPMTRSLERICAFVFFFLKGGAQEMHTFEKPFKDLRKQTTLFKCTFNAMTIVSE